MNIATLTLSRVASAVLAASRFISPTNGVPSAGGNTLGVTRTSAASGDLVPVDAAGTAIVETAGAIADGGAIETDANGKALAKNTGATVARALQAATGAGQFIEVLLIQN